MGIKSAVDQVKGQYDKILTFLSLVLLLSSLVYLAVRVSLIQRMRQDFDEEMAAYRAQHESADVVSSNLYVTVVDKIRHPLLINNATWEQLAMTVPEVRVTCTYEKCLLPIPYDSKVCPRCSSPQKEPVINPDVPKDSDGDGMLDAWERKYGLDPYDASDADSDMDEDGHSNLAEFRADTEPNNPESRPSVIDQLVVENIQGVRFGMLFKSRVKTSQGMKFGLNFVEDGEVKTTFVSMGEVIAGYTVSNYVEKTVMQEKPILQKVDVSELTLVRGDHVITLVRLQPYKQIELTAHFLLTFDGTRYKAKQGESITVDGERYTVIAIDRSNGRVVIRPENDVSKEIIIRPARAAVQE